MWLCCRPQSLLYCLALKMAACEQCSAEFTDQVCVKFCPSCGFERNGKTSLNKEPIFTDLTVFYGLTSGAKLFVSLKYIKHDRYKTFSPYYSTIGSPKMRVEIFTLAHGARACIESTQFIIMTRLARVLTEIYYNVY